MRRDTSASGLRGPEPPPEKRAPSDRGKVEGRKCNCDAGNTRSLNSQSATAGKASHEAADDYSGEVARLSARWRVVTCRDSIQWIVQQRDAGSPHRARWRGRHYCVTREALIRLCGSLQEAPDPAAMAVLASLPAQFPRGER